MSRAFAVIVSTAVVILGLLGAPALAGPPVTHTPVSDGPVPHTHHVVTPAGCKNIDAVTFYRVGSGLHRGAVSSGANGPEHLPCPT